MEKENKDINIKVGSYLGNIIFGGIFKDKKGNSIIISNGYLQINQNKLEAFLELDTTFSDTTCLFSPNVKDTKGYPTRYAIEYKNNVLKLFNVNYLGDEFIKKGKIAFEAYKAP
ncbi:MAG: hypothetical protein HQK79_09230 [Desulfobacterales bacterium]|nr:hypothetical protein [Desulfobacterales bacterium]